MISKALERRIRCQLGEKSTSDLQSLLAYLLERKPDSENIELIQKILIRRKS